MKKLVSGERPRTIGILGGGQLGRMLIYCSCKLGFQYLVLDPDPSAPARPLANHFIQGSLYDSHALQQLLKQSDITTYEIEHIDTKPLLEAEQAGYLLYPSPRLLKVIQDKWVQKEILSKAGVPVPRFSLFDGQNPSNYPMVQKSRRGGYDGRGVRVLRSPADVPMDTPSILEEFVPFQKELAVIVARDRAGNTALYPVVEMVFNPDHNICDTVLAPARIPPQVAEEACRVARLAVETLDGVGVFGVELFLTAEGKVLLNEVAPRPHNSGHYTIEACLTSQFEQHIRAITGLPLGATDLIQPAVMLNLLGEPGETGVPFVEGFEESLSIPGVSIHLYGKREVRPFRKMGHVTILGATTEEVLRKAETIRGILKVRSVKEHL
ncbi:MAG: 5-(carboxyamino)imidazole ribonucleotide synthase [Spirochaetes bacterium]|nr:5-(carboxyamino)imidazole ribonucleotide synthase [Spirochaetota bacterium]